MNLSPRYWVKTAANAAAFALRQKIRWRRGRPRLIGDDRPDDYAEWPGETRAEAHALAETLMERYALGPFRSILSRDQFRKNVYLLDVLEKVWRRLPAPPRPAASESFSALDVGTADWNYVFALHAFLKKRLSPSDTPDVAAGPPGEFRLAGLEIDGYGVYSNGYSRCDYAQAYVAALGDPGVSLRFENALEADSPPQDVLFCFFPFLLPYQILDWGLPLRQLKPAELLRRQASWLKPGGLWLLFTHAEEEREPMKRYLSAIPQLEWLDHGPIESRLDLPTGDYSERWFWLLRKAPRP